MKLAADFTPAWWCRGAHCQTLWRQLFRRPCMALRRERLELPDGDFLDLDWTASPNAAVTAPLVLVLHGLEGSSRSVYAQGLLAALVKHGFRGAVLHFRGCSGEPNRMSRSYHSGETQDLALVMDILKQRHVGPLGVVGFSLGGNVLLKWLGETGTRAVDAAVAVSVPFELARAADRLNRGFSRLYQWALLKSLKRGLARKARRVPLPVDLDAVERAKTFWHFDDAVTAPLHGFADVHDYYCKASSRQYLAGIAVPCLILHAADDPFMTPAAIPAAPELSATTRLEIAAHGGHVGFVAGAWPWAPRYWLERRICAYLTERLCH